jgi:hypothetical protein
MRGRYPNPNGQRHHDRPDRPAFGWITLRRGHGVKAPPLPRWRTWDPKTRTWWKRVWEMPQASEWRGCETGLEIMATLMDEVFKGNLTPIRASSELRQWASAYGMDPRSAQSLRWRLEHDEPLPQVEAPTAPREQPGDSRRTSLRVVDRGVA